MRKLTSSDFSVGKPLPFALYNEKGVMLLKDGKVIKSQRQADILIGKGLYVKEESASSGRRSADRDADKFEVETEKPPSPFEVINDFAFRLEKIFDSIYKKQQNVEERVLKLCDDFQDICSKDADAVLGAIHLKSDQKYVINRPLQTAVLCEMVARRFNVGKEHRKALMAAALTANVSTLELQETLYKQKERLSEEQRLQLEQHPIDSAKLLKAAGITNQRWLLMILQHHERLDGTGYPRGIGGSKLMMEARLLAIADVYGAAVSPRAYRKARIPRDAMCKFLRDESAQYDEKLATVFIKEVGVFPPGSFVKLINHEIGIVVRRGPDSLKPVVYSVINEKGAAVFGQAKRDVNLPKYKIKEMCFFDDTTFLNPHVIWGYT
jgi:HD-GYP domain-containing protein (c-di-GMP phosphodiesterase class II)